jgi:hypothetical protein
MAQTSESTRTTEYSALRLSYDDLSKTVIAIHHLVQKANEDVDCGGALESLEVDNGVSGITTSEDFSPAALSGAPETAYRAEYYFSCWGQAPISKVTLWLWDTSRTLTVTGRSAEQVQALSSFVTGNLSQFESVWGGLGFREVGSILLVLIAWLPIMGARQGEIGRHFLLLVGFGLAVSLALGVCPWSKWFPGTAVYSGSASFFVRNEPIISFSSVIVTLVTSGLGMWDAKASLRTPGSVTTQGKPSRSRRS